MTVAITYPVDALVSYHYCPQDNDMAPLAANARLRMIGDSGAFSALTQGAPINIDEYATWCLRWKPHLAWAASLDVIGDPVASLRNWRHLRDRYGLEVIPTLHAGADTKWLDVYAGEGVDFIGLGGMAGIGQAVRAFRWAVHVFRYARDRWPAARFHLWGVTGRQFLGALPAYSADSSGMLGSAYRYGSLRLFNPGTGTHQMVMLRGRGVYKAAGLLRRVYGIDPTEIETSHSGNRALLIKLGAANMQQYSAWLQHRHNNVTAPAWGLRPTTGPVSGPRLHAAETTPTDLLAATTGQESP